MRHQTWTSTSLARPIKYQSTKPSMPCTKSGSFKYNFLKPEAPSCINFRKMTAGNMESGVVPETHQKVEMQNKATVEKLYKALLGQGTMDMVAQLLASDLEWWFHGPPECQHMMRVLTGEAPHNNGFKFEPRTTTAIGDCVITEGWEGKAYWVHVWTLKNGLITQFREYFNTWLVVRDLRPLGWDAKQDSMTLWQSQPRDLYRRSLPGLVLAI